MKKKVNGSYFPVRALGLMIVMVALGSAATVGAQTTVPHSFSADTTAMASEVNANFQALADAIDNIPAGATGATGETGATGATGAAGSPDTADQVRGKFFSGSTCTDPNNPNDIMVKVGPICMDKYEASVWTAADGTGTQYGASASEGLSPPVDDYPGTFPDNGNWTSPLYAVSKAGVSPSGAITWFQAQQACANNGKRLPTNAEWQMAAAGTPDPGATDDASTECVVSGTNGGPFNTGARSACVSNWSVNDMIGNLWEWAAEWVPLSTAFPNWGAFSGDFMGLAGASTTDTIPGALQRGGSWHDADSSGIYAIHGTAGPTGSLGHNGFRCVR